MRVLCRHEANFTYDLMKYIERSRITSMFSISAMGVQRKEESQDHLHEEKAVSYVQRHAEPKASVAPHKSSSSRGVNQFESPS